MFGRGADEAEIKFKDFKPVVLSCMTGFWCKRSCYYFIGIIFFLMLHIGYNKLHRCWSIG